MLWLRVSFPFFSFSQLSFLFFFFFMLFFFGGGGNILSTIFLCTVAVLLFSDSLSFFFVDTVHSVFWHCLSTVPFWGATSFFRVFFFFFKSSVYTLFSFYIYCYIDITNFTIFSQLLRCKAQMHVQCKSTVHVVSGDATWRAGCSQEHPALKKIKNKKFIYNSLNFFYLFTLKKNRNTLK